MCIQGDLDVRPLAGVAIPMRGPLYTLHFGCLLGSVGSLLMHLVHVGRPTFENRCQVIVRVVG